MYQIEIGNRKQPASIVMRFELLQEAKTAFCSCMDLLEYSVESTYISLEKKEESRQIVGDSQDPQK